MLWWQFWFYCGWQGRSRAKDTGHPRMQAGRLLQLRFHWRKQGGIWARSAGDPRMPERCCGGSSGSIEGGKVVAGPGILGTLGCKQVGCCSCGFAGGSKVVAGPGLLGTLRCQKGAVAVLVLLWVARS